ncbi:MAG: DUF3850 domain-containing protein [Bacillota bacterium]|nr:DUF3850 domain-containing protein [Bacillota bacterium]
MNLKEIKDRADKATPGPWKVIDKGNTVKSFAVVSVAFDNSPQQMICPNMSPKTGNAAFIAHAREDIPALIKAYEAKCEEVERLQAAYDELNDFEKSQCAKLLAENSRLRAELEQTRAERDAAARKYKRRCRDDFDEILPVEYSGTTHHLKTVQPYYDASATGEKTFEIRKDDRNYAVGDILHLYEWDGEYDKGNSHYKQVTYCLRDVPYVPEGYVCLGVIPISWECAKDARIEWHGADWRRGDR